MTYVACHVCLQLEELKQMKDSSTQDILERLSSARSESSSLSEQLALAKRNAEAEHKENLKLQKVIAHCSQLPVGLLQDTPVISHSLTMSWYSKWVALGWREHWPSLLFKQLRPKLLLI